HDADERRFGGSALLLCRCDGARETAGDVRRLVWRLRGVADPEILGAATVHVKGFPWYEHDRFAQGMVPDGSRLHAAAQTAPQIQPAVGRRKSHRSRSELLLKRSHERVASAAVLGPKRGEM